VWCAGGWRPAACYAVALPVPAVARPSPPRHGAQPHQLHAKHLGRPPLVHHRLHQARKVQRAAVAFLQGRVRRGLAVVALLQGHLRRGLAVEELQQEHAQGVPPRVHHLRGAVAAGARSMSFPHGGRPCHPRRVLLLCSSSASKSGNLRWPSRTSTHLCSFPSVRATKRNGEWRRRQQRGGRWAPIGGPRSLEAEDRPRGTGGPRRPEAEERLRGPEAEERPREPAGGEA
jgi:hypothetical protein